MGKSVLKRQCNDVDVYVGERIRAGRAVRKMSQMKLAEALGVSFQQIQKYEKGKNRVSVGALVAVANALNLNPGWFLKGAPGVKTLGGPGITASTRFFASRGGAELAERFLELSPRDRTVVANVAQSLAAQ